MSGAHQKYLCDAVASLKNETLFITVFRVNDGMELDRDDLRVPEGEAPSPAALVDWVGAGAGLFNAD